VIVWTLPTNFLILGLLLTPVYLLKFVFFVLFQMLMTPIKKIWSIFSWAPNQKMLLKNSYSLTCTGKFMHETCWKWVF